MNNYEDRRDNLWKDAFKNDKAFSHGESPTAKVISFFCKRKPDEEVVTGKVAKPKEVLYDRVVEVSWLEERLNKSIQYTRSWSDYKLYQLGALQEYLDYVKVGGYSKALISTQELAALLPNKK